MADKYEFHQNRWQKIRDARSLAELREILEHLLLLARGNALSEDEYELLSMAFDALQEFTSDDAAKGRLLILKYLLPTIEFLEKAELASDFVIERCIGCLADWISQYSRVEQIALRDEVLDTLVQGLQSAPQTSALRSISVIGYRRPDIVNALWDVAECYENKTGDTALLVLASLGVPFNQRPQLLSVLHERAIKRCNLPLISALGLLASPSSIEVVQKYWLEPIRLEVPKREKSERLRILLDIADRQDSDALLADHIWHILSDFLHTDEQIHGFSIYLVGDVVPRCNSQFVVQDLLGWLQLNQEARGRNDHRRHLSYSRLEECIRPCQLRGWKRVDLFSSVRVPASVVEILRRDALQDTKSKSRALTKRSHVKQNAWRTLFRLEYAEALNWAEDALFSEANPYVTVQISELLACFSLTPLPLSVRKWVTEPYNDTKNSYDGSGEFTVRRAAIQLARSAASYEAFSALLHFGLRRDGKVLAESIWALADVASYLAKSGEAGVIEKLVGTVVNSPHVKQRIAAAKALELVAAQDILSAEQLSKLIPLMSDAQREPYERRALIGMLAHLPPESVLISDMVNSLSEWALLRDDWLGLRSLETLARLDCLFSQKQLLSSRLGLRQVGKQWDFSPSAAPFDKAALIIGLLYSHHPHAFEPAIVSLLRRENWQAIWQMTDLVARLHEQKPALGLPKSIEEALIERTRARQRGSRPETGIFQLLARLVPNRLAMEKWELIWHLWRSNPRLALADSLGKATYTTAKANKRATSLLLLLTRDGEYAIRRAAYRALLRHSPRSQRELCKVYASAPEVELRQRAAEAIGWLGNEENANQLFSNLYQELVTDPEPTVRSTAERIRLERRERLWAAQYLAMVRSVTGKSNQEVLSCWRYGSALTQIGDDGTICALRTHLATGTLPPNVRYWIRQLIKALEKRWQKETEKWPEFWSDWQGAIEEGQGYLWSQDGQKAKGHYSIWLKATPTPKQNNSWGGKIWLTEKPHFELNGSDLLLQLEDGRQGEAVASRYSLSGEEVTLAGNGKFPA